MGKVTAYAYDAAGNRVRETYGAVETSHPDASVRSSEAGIEEDGALRYTFNKSLVTRYVYDEASRLLEKHDAGGYTTKYTYDDKGRLTTFIDARGHSTSFTYNTLDQTLTRTDAKGNVTAYEYDAAGRMLTVTDARKNKLVFTYDIAKRTVDIFKGKDETGKDIRILQQYDEVGPRGDDQHPRFQNVVRLRPGRSIAQTDHTQRDHRVPL